MLNVLKQVATLEILHEKHGDPPPQRFPTWQAFWHNRFFALQLSSDATHHGHVSVQQIADADIAFIKQKRAELVLPPVE